MQAASRPGELPEPRETWALLVLSFCLRDLRGRCEGDAAVPPSDPPAHGVCQGSSTKQTGAPSGYLKVRKRAGIRGLVRMGQEGRTWGRETEKERKGGKELPGHGGKESETERRQGMGGPRPRQ